MTPVASDDPPRELVQCPALGHGREQLPLPAQTGREPGDALCGDRGQDVLGDRGERDLHRDLEQRQPVSLAGSDEIIRDQTELCRPGGQADGPRAGDRGDELLAVIGVGAPREATDHELTAGQVARGSSQLGGIYPADLVAELLLVAHQQPQSQLGDTQQVAQDHDEYLPADGRLEETTIGATESSHTSCAARVSRPWRNGCTGT